MQRFIIKSEMHYRLPPKGEAPIISASSWSRNCSYAIIKACVQTSQASHVSLTPGGLMLRRSQALQTMYSPVRYFGQRILLLPAPDQVEKPFAPVQVLPHQVN